MNTDNREFIYKVAKFWNGKIFPKLMKSAVEQTDLGNYESSKALLAVLKAINDTIGEELAAVRLPRPSLYRRFWDAIWP